MSEKKGGIVPNSESKIPDPLLPGEKLIHKNKIDEPRKLLKDNEIDYFETGICFDCNKTVALFMNMAIQSRNNILVWICRECLINNYEKQLSELK